MASVVTTLEDLLTSFEPNIAKVLSKLGGAVPATLIAGGEDLLRSWLDGQFSNLLITIQPDVLARLAKDDWGPNGRTTGITVYTQTDLIQTLLYFPTEYAAIHMGIKQGADVIAEETRIWLRSQGATEILTSQIVPGMTMPLLVATACTVIQGLVMGTIKPVEPVAPVPLLTPVVPAPVPVVPAPVSPPAESPS